MFGSLLICALFVLGAAAQNPLAQAATLARAQRYAEARQALAGVHEPAAPAERIALHRLKAAIASGLGETAAAATEMRSAVALAPGDATLLLAAAVAELQAGQLEQALRHASAAGNTAAAQAVTGDIQERRGQFLEAAKAYQNAVRLAPDREQYRIALALEFVEHQTLLAAIDVLEQAAPHFPRSARIRTLLGIAHYANGTPDAAIAALLSALALDPHLEPAYLCLSRIALESSAAPPPAAIQALCGFNAVLCAAMQLRAAREQDNSALFDRAVDVLKRAPDSDATARCELGRAYEWRSQWREAREQMEACVALDPSARNHYRLGLIYKQLGLTEPARREMDLRGELLRKSAEEEQRRLHEVQAFRYSAKP